MKINFNKSDEEPKRKSRAIAGDHEDMKRTRKEEMPHIMENIQEIFQDYNGELVAVVRIEEDSKGNPQGVNFLVSGVASASASQRMVSALREAADEVQNHVIEGAKEHPGILGEILGDMLRDALNKRKDK